MELIFGLGTALWIGILTSISPCPLATNVAAISFISKEVKNSKMVLLTGVLYALGRMFAYIGITLIVVKSIYSVSSLSYFLQTQMHKILGPLLIVVGMLILELISVSLPSFLSLNRVKTVFQNMGIWGAFPLGILFALSFCPVSAALYFGSLVPLVTKISSPVLLPSMYGIGTGIPVFVFAVLISLGTGRIGKVFKSIGKFEYWFRTIAGIILIAIGIYLSLVYICSVL